MKIVFLPILTLCCFVSTLTAGLSESPSFARSEEEQVELLITSAQATLEKLSTLKEALQAFRNQEALCVANPSNRDQLYILSQRAYDLSIALNQCRLNEYFRPSFIEEITRLSQVAAHPTLPSAGQDQIP